MNKPLLVGLTGGIGSGKSTVAKVFKTLSVPVFNSDDIAKNIINNDIDVIREVTTEFGTVYSDGKLDKVKMAAIVFNDADALEKLNKIIHPKVAEHFQKWIEENKEAAILIKEAAILIESGAYKKMDKIVLVTAPEKIRIQRVVKRDKTSNQKVKERIQTQFSDKEKMSYADYTIVNDDKQLIIPQVIEVYESLRN